MQVIASLAYLVYFIDGFKQFWLRQAWGFDSELSFYYICGKILVSLVSLVVSLWGSGFLMVFLAVAVLGGGLLWVCFGFLGFFAVFMFSLSYFLLLDVLLYTFCVLRLHLFALLIYETLLIKKKKKKILKA
jgi:hypothetical protein